MKRSFTPGIVLTLVLAFFYAPIVVLVVNSFNASRFGGEWKGFTWSWYEKLWEKEEIWASLWLSLQIAVLASLASMVLGTLAALALHKFRSRLQQAHRALLTVPLVMPDILMGISLLLFFASAGLPLGFFSIWVAHVTFCVSYVTLVVLARLQDFDQSLIDAARDLGASPAQAAFRVLLPLLAPGVLAGGLLAFTMSIDDYVITYFVGGVDTNTLPIRIYGMIKRSREMPVINALSTLMLVVTFAAVSVSFWLTRRGEARSERSPAS